MEGDKWTTLQTPSQQHLFETLHIEEEWRIYASVNIVVITVQVPISHVIKLSHAMANRQDYDKTLQYNQFL